MNNINFLLIDDDQEQKDKFIEAINEINQEDAINNLTYIVAETPEAAMVELYQNYFQAIIIDLKLKEYSGSVFKIFGSRGKINRETKELFWNVMPKYFGHENNDIEQLPLERQETVIIRYISSWFSNKYMFDDKYLDVDPIEMYMFPNPIEQVCTCDIYKKSIGQYSYEYFIVLTPSCDLANKKIDKVLLEFNCDSVLKNL